MLDKIKHMTLAIFFMSNLAFGKTIELFTWWDYFSPAVKENLKNKGFKFKFVEYRSSEVALSKLLTQRGRYDVAIIPGWVASSLEKANVIDAEGLSKLHKSRKYLKEFRTINKGCVPFLWGVSLFAYNSKVVNEVNSLQQLLSLKKGGRRIGIVDDQVEFIARWKHDYQSEDKCNSKKIKEKCMGKIKKQLQAVSSGDFVSSFDSSKVDFASVYGWHGELSQFIESKNNFLISFPTNSTFWGADYVCLLKGKLKRRESVFKFIKELSSFINTEKHVRSTHYFSPYKDSKGATLSSRLKKVYTKAKVKINKSVIVQTHEYIFSNKDQLDLIWRELRFKNDK
jgi:spermidine/putrescine-binding protein